MLLNRSVRIRPDNVYSLVWFLLRIQLCQPIYLGIYHLASRPVLLKSIHPARLHHKMFLNCRFLLCH